jgi:hypothetical protein
VGGERRGLGTRLGEMNLLPKVCPLSVETMTFRLSLPSPFQAIYMLPFRELPI